MKPLLLAAYIIWQVAGAALAFDIMKSMVDTGALPLWGAVAAWTAGVALAVAVPVMVDRIWKKGI